MAKLNVESLHLSYGEFKVLKGVSLDLKHGEVMVLLGASGSGKTTLLRAIAGLEAPEAGAITIDGEKVYDSASRTDLLTSRRGLGMVFQSYALWPHRTVFQNVSYGLKLRGVGRADIASRTATVLQNLGLGHLAERYPYQLSGGQQQRVAIARALVYNPPVLLMDEPLSNLDAQLREEAKTWLKSVIVEMKLSAVIVTHDQTEAMAMGDRIVLLADGRIEQQGTPTDIYSNPGSETVAGFFGTNNRFSGQISRIKDGIAHMKLGDVEIAGSPREALAVGQTCNAIVRVENCDVDDQPGLGKLPCQVVASMFVGLHWEHILKFGDVRLRAFGRSQLTHGMCWLGFAPSALWVFPSTTKA